MVRSELDEYVKKFCEENDLQFVISVRSIKDVEINVLGENAIEKLDKCLSALGVEYTKPAVYYGMVESTVRNVRYSENEVCIFPDWCKAYMLGDLAD